MSVPKYNVGQVLIWESQAKHKSYPFVVLEVQEEGGEWFYRFDKRNMLHESMVRQLTPKEAGIEVPQ